MFPYSRGVSAPTLSSRSASSSSRFRRAIRAFARARSDLSRFRRVKRAASSGELGEAVAVIDLEGCGGIGAVEGSKSTSARRARSAFILLRGSDEFLVAMSLSLTHRDKGVR